MTKEIKLSQHIKDNESNWYHHNNHLLTKLITLLNKKLNTNLSKKYNISNSGQLFEYLSCFLLANYQNILYDSFAELNIDINEYEHQTLISLILSINKDRDNVLFLISIFKKAKIVKDVYYNDNNEYFVETYDYGTITFKKASLVYSDEPTKSLFRKDDLYDGCHQYSLEFLKLHPETIAVTSICRRNIQLNYYHSFIIADDKVIDVANNLIINKEAYFLLEQPVELKRLTYTLYQKEKDLSKPFDESNTLFDLLRIATYEEITKNKNL